MARINYASMNDSYITVFGQFVTALRNLERIKDEFKEREDSLSEKKDALMAQREKALAENPANRDSIIAQYDVSDVIAQIDALKDERKKAESPFKAMRDAAVVAIIATDAEREDYENTGKLGELSLSKAYTLSCEPNRTADSVGKYTVTKGKKTVEVEVEVSFTKQLKALYERLGMVCDSAKALNKSVEGVKNMCAGMRRAGTDEGFLKAKNARVFNEDLVRALCRQMFVENKAFTLSYDESGNCTITRVEF